MYLLDPDLPLFCTSPLQEQSLDQRPSEHVTLDTGVSQDGNLMEPGGDSDLRSIPFVGSVAVVVRNCFGTIVCTGSHPKPLS